MWRPWNVEDVSEPQEIVDDIEIIEEVEMVEETANISQNVPLEKPRVKRIHLSSDAKQIAMNVYEYIRNTEGDVGATKKTSRMTKVPESTIRKIVQEGIHKRKVREDVGFSRTFKDYHADLIRRIIYDAYKINIVLTLEELHNKVKTELNIKCCKDTLRIFLKKINFQFKIINKRQVLMESLRISSWRVDYLNKIKKFREENRSIVYLDETWFDTHDTVKKGWCDNSNKCVMDTPSSHGKRIIILHAGSKNGWIEDVLLLSAKNVKNASLDYHDNMTAELFEDWFGNQLLEKLEPNSVIVMDNASYHSAQIKKIPNTSSNKEEIKDFLFENELYFEENYTKKELLEVLKTKEFKKTYKVDCNANQHRNKHTVLRLPPYHCIFNPIEMIWHELKSHVRRNNTAPKFSDSTINVIRQEVSKISKESWANCVNHVIKEEDVYRQRLVAELIIDVNDETTSDDEFFNELSD